MRKRNAIPSQQVLRSLFDYCDGHLIWKKSSGPRAKKGSRLGYIHHNGYIRGAISGKKYAVHRLIYMWHHGSCPHEIDHINRVRNDNRIENLRGATRSSNTHNSPAKGKLGIRGVHWDKYQPRYRVQIYLNGKQINLGSSKDFFEACCIRKRAERDHPDY